jgi:hypothetical protein
MPRKLPLHRMAPDAPLKGTVLAAGLSDNGEIVQRLKDMMEL